MGHGEGPAFQFGSLVRTHRREAGLTQRELAAKAGLSGAALRDFEQSRRRPRPHSLAAVATALGLNPDQAATLAGAAALPRQRRQQDGSRPARTAYAPGQRDGLWLSALGPLEAWGDG